MQRLVTIAALVGVTLALGGCSTVDDVLAYGKGPFDHAPIPRSETALEGLHESSWGNSGKWGRQKAGSVGAETGSVDQREGEEPEAGRSEDAPPTSRQ